MNQKKNLKLSHPVIKGTVVSISDGRFCVLWGLHKAHMQTAEWCLWSAWPHNMALGTFCMLVGVCLPIHFNYLHLVWKQIIKVFRMHLHLVGLLWVFIVVVLFCFLKTLSSQVLMRTALSVGWRFKPDFCYCFGCISMTRDFIRLPHQIEQ